MTQPADGPGYINAVTALDEVVRKTQFWRMTLRGHTKSVTLAVFSPDGTRILTASRDNTARTWFSSVSEYLTVARRLIQRNPPDFTPEERARYGLDQ